MTEQLALDWTAPYVRHSRTSRAAAESIQDIAPTKRARVLAYLKQRSATDEEIGRDLDLPLNTVRPRRRELELAGLVIDSGETRLTASGRAAVIWRAV